MKKQVIKSLSLATLILGAANLTVVSAEETSTTTVTTANAEETSTTATTTTERGATENTSQTSTTNTDSKQNNSQSEENRELKILKDEKLGVVVEFLSSETTEVNKIEVSVGEPYKFNSVLTDTEDMILEYEIKAYSTDGKRLRVTPVHQIHFPKQQNQTVKHVGAIHYFPNGEEDSLLGKSGGEYRISSQSSDSLSIVPDSPYLTNLATTYKIRYTEITSENPSTEIINDAFDISFTKYEDGSRIRYTTKRPKDLKDAYGIPATLVDEKGMIVQDGIYYIASFRDEYSLSYINTLNLSNLKDGKYRLEYNSDNEKITTYSGIRTYYKGNTEYFEVKNGRYVDPTAAKPETTTTETNTTTATTVASTTDTTATEPKTTVTEATTQSQTTATKTGVTETPKTEGQKNTEKDSNSEAIAKGDYSPLKGTWSGTVKSSGETVTVNLFEELQKDTQEQKPTTQPIKPANTPKVNSGRKLPSTGEVVTPILTLIGTLAVVIATVLGLKRKEK